MPEPAMRLARAAASGNHVETARVEARFAPLWDLFRTFGSLRVVYAMARLMGLTQVRPPRPIMPLEGHDLDRVASALEHLGATGPVA